MATNNVTTATTKRSPSRPYVLPLNSSDELVSVLVKSDDMTSKSLGSDDGSAEPKRGVKGDHDGDGPGNQDAGHDAHLPLASPLRTCRTPPMIWMTPKMKAMAMMMPRAIPRPCWSCPVPVAAWQHWDREFSHNDVSLRIEWLWLRSYLLNNQTFISADVW